MPEYTGVSRKELRRMILNRVGDLKVLTATANGSNVTFIDATNLVGEQNAFRDREVLFTGGTALNLGLTRHVAGSDKAQRAIGFGLALPAATQVGDEVELVNARGIGFTFADVHQALDNAMAIARTVVSDPVYAVIPTPFNALDGFVEVPEEWTKVSGIEWQDGSGRWRPIRIAPRLGGDGWSPDRANRWILVGGTMGRRIDAKIVRLRGYKPIDPLLTDADTTMVSTDWLVAESISQLLSANALTYPTPERQRAAERAERSAQGLRYMLASRLAPGTVDMTR